MQLYDGLVHIDGLDTPMGILSGLRLHRVVIDQQMDVKFFLGALKLAEAHKNSVREYRFCPLGMLLDPIRTISPLPLTQ
jgi:hypothetical protein